MAEFRVEMLLVTLVASIALFAQNSGPDKHQSDASVLDARLVDDLAVNETCHQTRHDPGQG
jgi:hypothetical protein